MKTQTLQIWILGMALLTALLPDGLAQNEIDSSPASARDAAHISPGLPAPPEPYVPATNVPPKVHLSPWMAEVVKLAQHGVEDSVLLSFIDNAGMFNLGAEEIIYLTDLGVSSEVISEMLRHDAEVITGARQLTISSQPPSDASVRITFTAASPATDKKSLPPATTPAQPDLVNDQLTSAQDQPSSPEADQVITNSDTHVWESAKTPSSSEAFGQQAKSPEGKGSYPVREPYPVPLTVPIYIVQAAERTPNTIVIEWLPARTDER